MAGAGTGLPTAYKNNPNYHHHHKTAERILRLDLDDSSKPSPPTNSIKEFIAPWGETHHNNRVPVEVKVALHSSSQAGHGQALPVENGLNFGGANNTNNGNNGKGKGMFEFGGMALLSYQVYTTT